MKSELATRIRVLASVGEFEIRITGLLESAWPHPQCGPIHNAAPSTMRPNYAIRSQGMASGVVRCEVIVLDDGASDWNAEARELLQTNF